MAPIKDKKNVKKDKQIDKQIDKQNDKNKSQNQDEKNDIADNNETNVEETANETLQENDLANAQALTKEEEEQMRATEPHMKEALLPRFSLNRPVTVTMILLAVLVVGAISYQRIKMDLFPAGLSLPFMRIWAPYRDANPKELEDQVVKPIESELKTVKNMKRLFSYSGSTGSVFWMEFSQDTDMDIAYSQVADRVDRARPYLPDDLEHIYVQRFRDTDRPIIYMGISFDDTVADPYYASDKYIKQAMEGIKGVANVELFGIREKNVQIILDSDKIKTYRVNLPQLMATVMKDNFAMSNGYVRVGGKKFMLRTKSRFRSLDDIRNIEIGNGIRLEHIADVVYDFDEEQRNIMRVDGNIAAGLVVYKESEANTVDVCKRIVAKLEEQSQKPQLKGVGYFIFWNQGKEILSSIDNVKTTMLWGGFFAFFVLLLFLRKIKITLMLTLAIPLSILISVVCIYAFGWTLNAVTMMGLMISIGLVVDNSIVITENIYRLNGLGFDTRRASILGASEVGLAIFLATLTTAVVFLPMMFMGGDSILSFYLIRIGLPVIFAIGGSLLIALILIPLAATKAVPKKADIIYATHSPILQYYQTTLVKILKHRLSALVLVAILILSTFIPIALMKKSDQGEGGPRDAKVLCNFPPNYNVQKVDKTLAYISKGLWEKEDYYHIDHISSRAFSLFGRIDIYLKPDKDVQWYSVVYRKIANFFGFSNYRRLSREELTEDIKKNLPVIPGVKMRTSWDQQTGGEDDAIIYTLSGYDIGVLDILAQELEKQIKLVDGVLSVETDMETGNNEIHIFTDRDKAFKMGTNPNYLAQLVRFTLGKRKISNYQTPEKEIEIFVKSKKEQRESVAQLKNMFVKTDSGKETSLESISDLTYHKSVGNIRRENSKSTLEMKVYTGERDMDVLGEQLEQIFKNFKFPTGYAYNKGGRSVRFGEQNTNLMIILLFSFFLVYLIMGILFESFSLPLSVLVTIFAAFVGSFWLLYLTGTTFEIMAGIGLVVLIGVVVNNGIVLIDLINQYRISGMQREQAILVAAMHRFRPILMTALTTIMGLMPMAVGKTGLIGIPYTPMGVTLIGGLISSTFLTLFAVPVFYTYFDDFWGFLVGVFKRF